MDKELLSKIFNDCWRLLLKYRDTRSDDTFWTSLLADMNTITKKYDDSFIASKLTLAIADILETYERTKEK